MGNFGSKKLVVSWFAIQTVLLFYLVLTTVSRNECSCPKWEINNSDKIPIPRSVATNVTSNVDVATKEVSKGSLLNYYTIVKFAHRGWMFPLDSKLCVQTRRGVVPDFKICVHEPEQDIWISKDIINHGYWEADLAQWLNAIRPKMDEVLYMDLGSNLGIHGLHAAKAGCSVWAVEPQEKNLQRIIQSSILSGVNHRMTFVQNAVDGVRRKVQMAVDGTNNGGSYIKEFHDTSVDAIETVLLSDIFQEAVSQARPKSVVIKADIETYECRAFLNSQQVFEHPSTKSVIFEWAGTSENCSADDFKRVLNLLRKNGFKLYQLIGKWTDASHVPDDKLLTTKGANLFWSKISPI